MTVTVPTPERRLELEKMYADAKVAAETILEARQRAELLEHNARHALEDATALVESLFRKQDAADRRVAALELELEGKDASPLEPLPELTAEERAGIAAATNLGALGEELGRLRGAPGCVVAGCVLDARLEVAADGTASSEPQPMCEPHARHFCEALSAAGQNPRVRRLEVQP